MKAIILDFDGTIADTIPAITEGVNLAMRALNLPEHTEEEVKGFINNGSRELIRGALPEEYRRDLLTLGSKSGRDGDKAALTRLRPLALEHGVDFEQAELTFVCKKLYAQQFELEKVPREVADWIYTRVPPHTMFIGEVVDVIERQA